MLLVEPVLVWDCILGVGWTLEVDGITMLLINRLEK